MEEHQFLLQPLLPTKCTTKSSTTFSSSSSTATVNATSSSQSCVEHVAFSGTGSTSNYGITIRLLSIFLIAVISLWANYEASRHFHITIINEAKESPAGLRFSLFYVSNDKASRIVLNTSSFVENLLYPDNLQAKKHINHITLRLASRNLSLTVIVTRNNSDKNNDYVIDLSPSLLDETNFDHAIVSAVQRAMARIWLWDGESKAPMSLVDGMAEYIVELSGFGGMKASDSGELPECGHGWPWWEEKEPKVVAHFLHYCEMYKEGFIQRLNEAMKERWDEQTIDNVLGMPIQ